MTVAYAYAMIDGEAIPADGAVLAAALPR